MTDRKSPQVTPPPTGEHSAFQDQIVRTRYIRDLHGRVSGPRMGHPKTSHLHADYFELKLLKKLPLQEETPAPSVPLKAGGVSPM